MTANTNTDESTDDDKSKLTRREAMQTGGAVATTALLSKFSTGVSQAQETGTEPRIALGDDWEIDDYSDGAGNTDLRIRHIPSGAQLQYDVSEETWKLPSVDIDEFHTVPTGCIAQIDGNQSVTSGGVNTVEFATEYSTRGNVNQLLNATTHAIEIPAGYNWARCTYGLRWSTSVQVTAMSVLLNGSSVPGLYEQKTTSNAQQSDTSWIPVESGDELTLIARQESGSTVDIVDSPGTAIEVWIV